MDPQKNESSDEEVEDKSGTNRPLSFTKILHVQQNNAIIDPQL